MMMIMKMMVMTIMMLMMMMVRILISIYQEWLNANFKKTERRELVIIKSENVLTPTALQKVRPHFFKMINRT